MKKKRKIKRCRKRALKHVITARNDDCRRIIQQISKNHDIHFYKNGHVKNRLYYKCDEKTWVSFYKKIKDLCMDSKPVHCPNWLQKKILKNLKKASNNKLWPECAKKANEILDSLKAKQHAPETPINTTPSTVESSIPTDSSVEHVSVSGSLEKSFVHRLVYGVFSWLKNILKKLTGSRINAVGTFSGLKD